MDHHQTLAGILNLAADGASHLFDDSKEWTMPEQWFIVINNHFGPLDVDLFALSANHRLQWFISWFSRCGFTDCWCPYCTMDSIWFILCNATCFSCQQNSGQNHFRRHRAHHHSAVLGVKTLVPKAHQNVVRHSSSPAKISGAVSTMGR